MDYASFGGHRINSELMAAIEEALPLVMKFGYMHDFEDVWLVHRVISVRRFGDRVSKDLLWSARELAHCLGTIESKVPTTELGYPVTRRAREKLESALAVADGRPRFRRLGGFAERLVHGFRFLGLWHGVQRI